MNEPPDRSTDCSRDADIEAERAEVIAQVREAARVAVSRATLHSKSNLGVGYLNVHLKALERLARLLGLDAPARTELTSKDSGPVEIAPHPIDVLPPEQLAARMRLWAEELEAEALEAEGA